MRCQSAARAKFKTRYVGVPPRDKPQDGTLLRENFERLHARKGLPVELAGNPIRRNNHIRLLTDFYGLDIRLVQRSDKRVARPPLHVLAGEWFGRVYVDYIAERIEEKTQ